MSTAIASLDHLRPALWTREDLEAKFGRVFEDSQDKRDRDAYLNRLDTLSDDELDEISYAARCLS